MFCTLNIYEQDIYIYPAHISKEHLKHEGQVIYLMISNGEG